MISFEHQGFINWTPYSLVSKLQCNVQTKNFFLYKYFYWFTSFLWKTVEEHEDEKEGVEIWHAPTPLNRKEHCVYIVFMSSFHNFWLFSSPWRCASLFTLFTDINENYSSIRKLYFAFHTFSFFSFQMHF